MRIVIVGNGIAGMEAARTLRLAQPDWSITLVSEESDHCVSRTALMWVCSGQMSYRDIEVFERDLYLRENLRRVRARAVGVDPERGVLRLANGEQLAYDRLLLACGSVPRKAPWPGADLLGVGHFVTLQDLEWLQTELHPGEKLALPPRARQHLSASTPDSPYVTRQVASQRRGRVPREVAVIGGGLIGIEAIEVMQAAGLAPHFFIREEWFWPLALDQRESTWIAERMSSHGVRVHLEHGMGSLVGDSEGLLRSIRTDQGEYEAELAVVAIGVVPNTGWLQDGPVALDSRGGIVVDEGLRTPLPGVFAAGDCASVRWFDGSTAPEQLWYTARDQGRVAARAMLGEAQRYGRGHWYNSAKLMDIEYTTVGLVNMGIEDEWQWFHEERGQVRSTTRIVMSGERVIGFNLLGRRWDHGPLLEWIEAGRSLPWVLTHLQEASFDSELVPPLVIAPEARAQARGVAGPSQRQGVPYPEVW